MRRPRAAAPRTTRTDPPGIPPAEPPQSAEETAQNALIMEALRASPRWPEIRHAFAPLVEDMTLGIEIFVKDVLDHNPNAAAATAALIGTGSWQKSNQPPEIMKPELLLELLAEDHKALIKRRDNLLAAAARFHQANSKITTPEIQAKAADFAVQLQKAIKAAEAAKDVAKEPLLALTAAAQNFFAKIWTPLQGEKSQVEAKQTAYAKSERDRVQAESKAEQDRLQKIADDAARAAADAMESDTDAGEAIAKAADAASDWDAATDVAQAKPADVTRVYGTAAVSSLRVRWKIRPAAIWQGLLPVAYLMPDQGKLDSALTHAPKKKDGTPILEIHGAELYTEEKIGNRG